MLRSVISCLRRTDTQPTLKYTARTAYTHTKAGNQRPDVGHIELLGEKREGKRFRKKLTEDGKKGRNKK